MRARVSVHKDFVISPIDDRVYSAFLEHLGRAVYGGIYEPDHKTADANGFRGDVLNLVRDLRPPLVRYPGGNFVSAYRWEDGIGPREERPVRLDLAWRTKEPNWVGTDEFGAWCDAADTEMMLAVNLGSRDLDAARNLLEYTNHSAALTGATCARRTAAPIPITSRCGASATRWTVPGRLATRRPRNMAASPTRPPRPCANTILR